MPVNGNIPADNKRVVRKMSKFPSAQSALEQEMVLRLRRPDVASRMRRTLREAGLRPTRARIALSSLLFTRGDRHVSAEMLFEEAKQCNVPVSLATIYNALNQFTEAGLLRQVAIDATRSYFDTNNSDHSHFYIEDRHELVDISPTEVIVGGAPRPPDGYEVVRVDVVVRLRRKTDDQQT